MKNSFFEPTLLNDPIQLPVSSENLKRNNGSDFMPMIMLWQFIIFHG